MRGLRKVKQLDQHPSAFSAGSRFQIHSLLKNPHCLREKKWDFKSLKILSWEPNVSKWLKEIIFIHSIISYYTFF